MTISNNKKEIVPFEEFVNNKTLKSTVMKPHVKSKVNLRKRLLKSFKKTPNNITSQRIKNLNVEIKNHFLLKRKMPFEEQ